MIEKLISINNIGKFAKLNLRNGGWDGCFEKNTIIYAPNGSGKTTLSMILESLRGDVEPIKKKITFPGQRILIDGAQTAALRVNGKTVHYKNGSWGEVFRNIEVFNIHFVENNLFSGSAQQKESGKTYFS